MTAIPPGRSGARRRSALLPLAAGLLLALPAAGPAAAQRAIDESPELRRMIQQLRPTTRGIRMPSEAPPASVAAVTAPVAATPAAPSPRPAPAPRMAAAATPTPHAELPSASLLVRFAHGSAVLTPEAERGLTILGRALTSEELGSYRFRIEGHTDTVGDAASNQALSERRAAAVQGFLIGRFGVDPARLEAIGLGESQPEVATPDETAEPRNRRVRVVNLNG